MMHLNLMTKFIAGFCGFILLIVTALLFLAGGEIQTYLEGELDKRGSSIGRNVAEASVTPILTGNRTKLQLILNDFMRYEEDLRYIYLVDNLEEVLAHTQGESFPHDLATHLKNGHLQVPRNGENERIRDLTVPIRDGDLGQVHLGLSEKGISANLRSIVLHVFPYVVAILFTGTLAAALFAATITRPVKALADGARMVGSGRLDWIIDVNTVDEIGELSYTFNRMTRELQRKITEHERAEEELRLKTELLEHEVAERQIAQRELAVKQQQLEILNHSLEERITSTLTDIRKKDQMLIQQNRLAGMGEMLSNIAHQWRQPLNNVGLKVQNLQMSFEFGELTADAMDKEVKSTMEIIQFMSRSIDDFRNFFRQDRTKSIFSINRAVATTLEIIMIGLKNKGISVEVEEAQEVEGYGHANEYSQVLVNIISNAQEIFQERSTAQPRISIRVFSDDDSKVVTVTDNGGGIDPAILPKIFDPYFTAKESAQGTGIGLYMSKVIIEQNMGGRILARNAGQGAEFRIEI